MKKLLVIEDDPVTGNIYRNLLSSQGYQVAVAADGRAGWEMVQSYHPDLVLLDLMLPQMNGMDVLKKIRAREDLKELPVIVFSNAYLPKTIQDATSLGASRCLVKCSCPPKVLIENVRELLAAAGPPPAKSPPAPSVPISLACPQLPTVSGDTREEFEFSLRKDFFESLPETIKDLRSLLQSVVRARGDAPQLKAMNEIYRRVHRLTANAALCSLPQIAQLLESFEALARLLCERPKAINRSTLRTIALASDFLQLLFEHGSPSEQEPSLILVVDDDLVSRRAVTLSLQKAKLRSINLSDPTLALALVSENRFELIILDIDMPGINGFELCEKLRQKPGYERVPVLFVTGLADLSNKANSAYCGADDFISKPFLFPELSLKALLHILRFRMMPGNGRVSVVPDLETAEAMPMRR